jgi:hypothetical protein
MAPKPMVKPACVPRVSTRHQVMMRTIRADRNRRKRLCGREINGLAAHRSRELALAA